MAGAPEAELEVLGVLRVEPHHAAREAVVGRGLEDEVDVIRHLAVAEDANGIFAGVLDQKILVIQPVGVGVVDVLALVATATDVERDVGRGETKGSSHDCEFPDKIVGGEPECSQKKPCAGGRRPRFSLTEVIDLSNHFEQS